MTTKEKKIPVTKTQITKHGDELVFYVGNHRYTVNKKPSWGTSVITSDSDKPALV
ncbi:MAG: hypothetical protein QM535_21145 [Limnohabitans sp.]|nr:hypothetical protein [Limnohabitans sp.]